MEESKKLTQEYLKSILDYDPGSGVFRWKVTRGKARAGDVAGYQHHDAYIHIRVSGKTYLAHRLAWLYEKGYFPEHGVDHRDRIRHHNWISNLREASRSCNGRNTGNFKHNTSGVKGVN